MTGACFYCLELVDDLTWDHKTPKCRGGSNRSDNLVPACVKCNSEKSCLTEREYMRLRANPRLRKAAVTFIMRELHWHAKRGEKFRLIDFDVLVAAARRIADERNGRATRKSA